MFEKGSADRFTTAADYDIIREDMQIIVTEKTAAVPPEYVNSGGRVLAA